MINNISQNSSSTSYLSLGLLLPFIIGLSDFNFNIVSSPDSSQKSVSFFEDASSSSSTFYDEFDVEYPFYISPPTSPNMNMNQFLEEENSWNEFNPFLDNFLCNTLNTIKDNIELKAELNKAKQIWKEIMSSLRTLDWSKVQK